MNKNSFLTHIQTYMLSMHRHTDGLRVFFLSLTNERSPYGCPIWRVVYAEKVITIIKIIAITRMMMMIVIRRTQTHYSKSGCFCSTPDMGLFFTSELFLLSFPSSEGSQKKYVIAYIRMSVCLSLFFMRTICLSHAHTAWLMNHATGG